MRLAFRCFLLLAIGTSLLVSCSRDPNVRKQRYLESGMRFFDKGKYNEAAIQFRNATQVDPSFGKAHYQLAQTYLKLQQDSRAFQELNLAIDKLDNEADKDRARLDLANLLIAHGDHAQAKEPLDAAEPRQQGNPSFYMTRANYDAGMKNMPRAMEDMQKAISLDPNRSDLYLNLAVLQLAAIPPGDDSSNRKQFDEAEANFKKAAAIDPKSTNAQLALGSFYQYRGRLAEADQQFRHAIEVDPKNPEPRKALVRLLVLEGKNGDAEEFARKTRQELSDDPNAYSMLGDYYFTLAGDVEKATNEYESLYKDHPKDPQVRKNYIQLLILRNRLDDATKLDDAILKNNPQDAEALVFRGQIKLREGKPNEAVSSLQDAVSHDPDNAAGHYNLGIAYDQIGDQSRAESEWREAVRSDPKMIEASRALAGVAMRKADWSGLNQLAATIIQAQPMLADGYALQAVAAINMKERDRAEQSVQKAIAVAPRNPLGYLQLGALRLMENKYAEAEKAYETVLELEPQSSDGLNGLMRVYLAQKDPDKAVAAARAKIAKSPNNSGFYDLLGTALFENKKDYRGAETALHKAIDLDKNNTDAILKLGQVLNAQGSPEQALALYQQGVKDHPREAPLYLLLGEMYEARRDWSNAKATYQKILELQPDNPVASNNFAYVMLQEGGNVDLALAMAQTARRGMPDSPNTADTLGWAYYKKGAYASAIGLLQEAVDKSPNDPSFQYHLGLAYQQAGRTASAKEHLQKVLKIDPNFPNADEVKKTLSELRG
jgi:tetratricopeptide (TPR) repeat protein